MESTPYIVGIRFQKVGKLYHFDASIDREITPGDFVVVETSRGKQLGQVIQVVANPQTPPEGTWKPIYRKATPQDLLLRQTWEKKEQEATASVRAKALELRISDAKFVASEFSFDGSRLSVLYSTESGEKKELKELRRVLIRLYPQTQIEFHMVGPRDVAKLLGGMGACGLEQRCCSAFLTEFSPIALKMAKEQDISLTPTEITGMCGKLRCCLGYEYERYVEARKQLPKRGKRVVTPAGEGTVSDVFPLKDSVMVQLDKGGQGEYERQDLQPWEELEVLKQKADAPCPKVPVIPSDRPEKIDKQDKKGKHRHRGPFPKRRS
jgi:cell fate regulator YaaT (PSP1 superfamily)